MTRRNRHKRRIYLQCERLELDPPHEGSGISVILFTDDEQSECMSR